MSAKRVDACVKMSELRSSSISSCAGPRTFSRARSARSARPLSMSSRMSILSRRSWVASTRALVARSARSISSESTIAWRSSASRATSARSTSAPVTRSRSDATSPAARSCSATLVDPTTFAAVIRPPAASSSSVTSSELTRSCRDTLSNSSARSLKSISNGVRSPEARRAASAMAMSTKSPSSRNPSSTRSPKSATAPDRRLPTSTSVACAKSLAATRPTSMRSTSCTAVVSTRSLRSTTVDSTKSAAVTRPCWMSSLRLATAWSMIACGSSDVMPRSPRSIRSASKSSSRVARPLPMMSAIDTRSTLSTRLVSWKPKSAMFVASALTSRMNPRFPTIEPSVTTSASTTSARVASPESRSSSRSTISLSSTRPWSARPFTPMRPDAAIGTSSTAFQSPTEALESTPAATRSARVAKPLSRRSSRSTWSPN